MGREKDARKCLNRVLYLETEGGGLSQEEAREMSWGLSMIMMIPIMMLSDHGSRGGENR